MNKSILTLSALIIFFVACKKEVERSLEDSPLITVSSPARNQAIEDSDTIRVKAVIEPNNTSVINYTVWLADGNNFVYNNKTSCNCKGKSTVNVYEKFLYDINKTSDLLLHIDAELEDGRYIQEEIPFKLVDSKK